MPGCKLQRFNAVTSNLFVIIIAFQDDTLHLFRDVLPCILAEKGSYGIYRTVNFSGEIQRLRMEHNDYAEPRYMYTEIVDGHQAKIDFNKYTGENKLN